MSKAVLISINPKWCELIANGKKTIEARKNKPKLYAPFKCYIYCTKGNLKVPHELLEIHGPDGKIRKTNGMVMGEFVCDNICPISILDNGAIQNWNFYDLQASCVPYDDLAAYIGVGKTGYGWHISDLLIYDKPKPLSMFYKECALLDNTGLCWECENAVGEECDCAVNGRLHLARPPQSWCYVEEPTEGGQST